MPFLIAIISILIIVFFWRVFLPIAILLVIVIIIFVANNENSAKLREEKVAESQRAEQEIYAQKQKQEEKDKLEQKEQIETAKKNENQNNNKKWVIKYEAEPATNLPIARSAEIESNDGLCTLSIYSKLEGGSNSQIYCPKLGIYLDYKKTIEIKFDSLTNSNQIGVNSYNNQSLLQINEPKDENFSNNGNLKYEDFVHFLFTANALAVKVPSAINFWTRFNLSDKTALYSLGKIKSKENFEE